MRELKIYASWRWSGDRESAVGETTHVVGDDLPPDQIGEHVVEHLRELHGAHVELRVHELTIHLQIGEVV